MCFHNIASVSMREKSVSDFDERAELEEYKRNMGWHEECKKGFFDWYDKHSKPSLSKEEKKVRFDKHTFSLMFS